MSVIGMLRKVTFAPRRLPNKLPCMEPRPLLLAAYLCVLLYIPAVAHSQGMTQQDKTAHSEMSWKPRVESGSMDGRSYHSDYFNFTYSLPDGFTEGTERYRQGILKQTGIPQSNDTFILFHADRQLTPSGEPTGGITIMADRMAGYPKGATEKDYLHHMVTQAMEKKGDNLLDEGNEVDVSGRKFFRADYRTNGHPLSGYQTVMLTFQKGFALSWSFSAPSKADVELVISSMKQTLLAR